MRSTAAEQDWPVNVRIHHFDGAPSQSQKTSAIHLAQRKATTASGWVLPLDVLCTRFDSGPVLTDSVQIGLPLNFDK